MCNVNSMIACRANHLADTDNKELIFSAFHKSMKNFITLSTMLIMKKTFAGGLTPTESTWL